MIIESLELANFLSYRVNREQGDERPVIFNFDNEELDKKNITIIVGHSGGGKTVVGKAIRWVLYNLPFGGEGKQEEQLTSEEKKSMMWRTEGGAVSKLPDERYMSVKMHIRPSASLEASFKKKNIKFGPYTLERKFQTTSYEKAATDKNSGSHFSIQGTDGNDIDYISEKFVSEFLLPEDTSTFYMLHGDKIKEIVNNISAEQSDAIKCIIDVTPTLNAKKDLEKIASKYGHDILNHSKASKEKNAMKGAIQQYDDEYAKYEKELKLKKESCKEKEKRRNEIIDKVDKYLDVIKGEEKISELKTAIKKLEIGLENVQEKLKDAVTKFTYEGLWHILGEKIEKHKVTNENNKEHENKWKEYEREIKTKKIIKQGDPCPSCNAICSKDDYNNALKDIKTLKDKIKKEKKGYVTLTPSVKDLLKITDRLEDIKYNAKQLQFESRKYEKEISIKKGLLMRHRDDLGGGKTPGNIKEMHDEESELRSNVALLKAEISDIEENKMVKNKKNKEFMYKRMNKLKLDPKYENYNDYQDLATELSNVFNSIWNELANGKRNEIAQQTGTMLFNLSMHPAKYNYEEPIKMTDNYQLIPISKSGGKLNWYGLNTGEKVMGAISFIYGLIKASEKEAPVILDTVFGHVDRQHYKNISKNLSSFSSQIILLITLEEFNSLKKLAVPEFWDKISKYFVVEWGEHTKWETKVKEIIDKDQAYREIDLQASQADERAIEQQKIREKRKLLGK